MITYLAFSLVSFLKTNEYSNIYLQNKLHKIVQDLNLALSGCDKQQANRLEDTEDPMLPDQDVLPDQQQNVTTLFNQNFSTLSMSDLLNLSNDLCSTVCDMNPLKPVYIDTTFDEANVGLTSKWASQINAILTNE